MLRGRESVGPGGAGRGAVAILTVLYAVSSPEGSAGAQPAGDVWLEAGGGAAVAPEHLRSHMTSVGFAARVAAGMHAASGLGVRIHALASLFPSSTDHIHVPGDTHPPVTPVLLGTVGISGILGSPVDGQSGGMYLALGGGYYATGNDAISPGSAWGWHVGLGRTVPLASRRLAIEVALHRAPGQGGVRGGSRPGLWLIPVTIGIRF